MREFCTSGSVGGPGSNPRVYPTEPGPLPDPDGHRATSGAKPARKQPRGGSHASTKCSTTTSTEPPQISEANGT
jgi:hypothetical protein